MAPIRRCEARDQGGVTGAISTITDPARTARTLDDLLRQRAQHQPDQCAYTFLVDGEAEETSITYGQLDRSARAIATSLQSLEAPHQRVLLCLPPGLDYIAAFFGCLYAGAIAVPAYPPDPSRLNRTLPPLRAIASDSRATLAVAPVATQSVVESLFAQDAELRRIRWLTIETALSAADHGWEKPSAGADDGPVFLLYTSGSTGTPKGVMVRHDNVLYNLAAFPGFESRPCTALVSWVPIFHDLGLLFGVLHPLFRGVRSVLLSPVSFVQRPLRWLEAISRFRASTTAAPNWAFDFCVRKTTPHQRAALDLRCLTLALNGGETIRLATLEGFTAAFAPCGFRREAFYPSYGLTEAIGTVSGGAAATGPVVKTVRESALQRHRVVGASQEEPDARTLVGCGQSLPGQEVLIIDPELSTACPPGHVGEVWVSGPSVCQGYWGRPDESQQTFHASRADSNDGTFLRTGDLGFLDAGELFITGRRKDLIIVHGDNHYASDIEASVERSHPALRPSCAAAFSVESGGHERLVVVSEVPPDLPFGPEEVIARIRHAISEYHGLSVAAVALVRQGTLLKTTSGKTRRHACRTAFTSRNVEIVAEWQESAAAASDALTVPAALPDRDGGPPTPAQVEAYLVSHFANRLGLATREIDVRAPFSRYGLSSVEAVGLAGALGTWLARSLPPTVVWEHPSIRSLASHLTSPSSHPEPDARRPSGRRVHEEPVAIVGMSCRFPGAKNLTAFWSLLCAGQDAITTVPAERWDMRAVPEKTISQWGGFLDDLDRFDAAFFGISPREAAHVDPRQRLILELAWEALEDAGIPPHGLAGTRAGVFIAVLSNDYDQLLFRDLRRVTAHSGPGTANSIVANRVSYCLDLRGPSLVVDTACSGSLVAIHLACQSVLSGESAVALAGGVSVNLLPNGNVFFTAAGALSPDGRCRTFDARANGMVRGEGAGVVVLKPLSRALADDDPIYAVIRGSAVNSDGRTNGLMAPNRLAQEAVLREAYERAGVSPGRVQYVEAHGTATSLGDPIEVQALGAVLGVDRLPGRRCALGSVKTNIGHLESTAGVAGLIKVALALKHRLLPPQLHFQDANPQIPFRDLPFVVQQALGPWPVESEPLIAGVSGFGFGGTNAHVVLEESLPMAETQPEPDRDEVGILALSARSASALRDLAAAYHDLLRDGENRPSLTSVWYTAATRRSHHDHRLAVVARSRDEVRNSLEAFMRGESASGLCHAVGRSERQPRLAFVFSGQGSHWHGMADELLKHEPVFRASLAECDAVFGKHAEWSLLDELVRTERASRLNETDVTQPAIFAIQVALAQLWRSWNIVPELVVGQSLGEIAAAHVAGALSLEDAVAVVLHRSRLMKRMAGQGKTAVVRLSWEQTALALGGFEESVFLAGSTSRGSSVLSGEPMALERLLRSLEQQGVPCRVLEGVDVAFHSPQMESLKAELVASLAGLSPRASSVPIVSTVTGRPIEGSSLDATYWARNLREPFQVTQAMEHLLTSGCDTFLEVGPHPVLSGSIVEAASETDRSVTVLASMRRADRQRETMRRSLGELYVRGLAVDWGSVYRRGRCIPVPTYPWQRQRHWFDELRGAESGTGPIPSAGHAPGVDRHPLLGEHVAVAFPAGQHVWQTEVSVSSPAYLADHRLDGMAVMPGSAYLEIALAAAAEAFGPGVYTIEDVVFERMLRLAEEDPRAVQLILSPRAPGDGSFQIHSRPARQGDSWVEHVAGTIRRTPAGGSETVAEALTLSQARARCAEEVSGQEHYRHMYARGFQYGAAFQAVERIWRRDGEALGELRLPQALESEADRYRIHPILLDAGFQVVAAALPGRASGAATEGVYLPIGVGKLRTDGRSGSRLWCHAVLRSGSVQRDADVLDADLALFDDAGRSVADVSGLRLRRMGGAPRAAAEDVDAWLYEVRWRLQERPALPTASGRSRQAGTWLLFADAGGLGAQLAKLLEERGQIPVVVHRGEAYRTEERGRRYTVNPDHDEEFRQLMQELVGLELTPCRGLVYMWGLEIPSADNLLEASLGSSQLLGCADALLLVRSAARSLPRPEPRFWLVTRGAQPVEGGESRLAVTQASLWGFGRVIANEHPELWGGLVDLDIEGQANEAELLLEELLNPDREDQIAVRGGRRYVPRLVRHVPRVAGPVGFRPDASYLITGGLGGLGLEVARWMVEQGARRLVLMARRELPPRSRWNEVGADDALAGPIAAIRRLERLGASIHLAAVDVADEAELSAFLQRFRDEAWPPIRGVMHAAGLVQDGLLLEMDRAALSAVLRPKVLGAWLLHRLLEEPLDFFILYSSVSSLLGPLGQASYAAANAFMDALAYLRRARGMPASSVSWGPWAEIGMAARGNLAERHARQGIDALTPAQGLRALARVVQDDPVHVAVARFDWQQWAAASQARRQLPLLSDLLERATAPAADEAQSGGSSLLQELVLLREPAKRHSLVQSRLQELAAKVLRLDTSRLDPRHRLNALGMDSIMAVEFKHRIETEFGLTVSMVELLEGSTISRLAERLAGELLDEARTAELLAEVEELSMEEVRTLLRVDESRLARPPHLVGGDVRRDG